MRKQYSDALLNNIFNYLEIPHYLAGYDLYLMEKFDIEQCKAIKGNAVILTNEDTAYFMIEDKIVIKNEKPHAVETTYRPWYSYACSKNQENI